MAAVEFDCRESAAGFDQFKTINWEGVSDTHQQGGYGSIHFFGGYAIKAYRFDDLDVACDEARREYEAMRPLLGCVGAANAYAWGVVTDARGRSVWRYPVLIEEWVLGVNLKKVWEDGLLSGGRPGPVPARARLEAALALARAVSEVAARGVCHRDLAPANVMIGAGGGESFVAKLVDFGQSARRESGVTPTARARLAWWDWGAPEVYGGPYYAMRNQTSVDVWSLGALCCYLLAADDSKWAPTPGMARTASRLWGEARVDEAKSYVVGQKRAINAAILLKDAPQRYGLEVASGLVNLMQRCLSYDPSQRPTAREVADELQRYARGSALPSYVTPEPVPAPQPTPGSPSPTPQPQPSSAGDVARDVETAVICFFVGLLLVSLVVDLTTGSQLGTTVIWFFGQVRDLFVSG